jgi:uncharacterized Tic20 family protein
MSTEVSAPIATDSKNMALLTWLGTLFLWFIPSLFFYLTQKNDGFVQTHAKEALNWSITILVGFILGFSLVFTLIGPFIVFAALGVLHVVYCLWGAACGFQGKALKLPLTVRLVQ